MSEEHPILDIPSGGSRGVFADASVPIFLLNSQRRLNYVNPAWEALTGRTERDVFGRACATSGPTEPLFRALAPPPEAIAGEAITVRRAPAAAGPPWWDVSYVPLGSHGFLGVVRVVEASPGEKPRSVPIALATLRQQTALRFGWDLFPDRTPAAARLQAQARLAASNTVPVWIHGPPGSGKTTLARVIHHASQSRELPVVVLDCGGVQPYLLESLVFGPGGVRTAKLGTLVLQSPAALPRDFQQRFAQWCSGPAAPRLICTSLQPAHADVASGTLLPEFHAQFAVQELQTLSLVARWADFSQIVATMIANTTHVAGPVTLRDECEPIVQAYRWPGNLRELREVLLSASDASPDGTLRPEHFPRYLRERALVAANPMPAARATPSLDTILEQVERNMIALALRNARGNQTEAAAALGIFRSRLGRRIDALNLKPEGTP